MKRHLIIALAFLAAPAAATAQQCTGRVVGTLGITGMECRDCSFSSHQGGLSAARFGTEPRILHVDQDASRGDDVEADDILVAIDGNLITTGAGVEVLTNLRPGQRVQLRVRRDGRVRDLAMIAGEACIPAPPTPPSPRAAPRAEAAPRPSAPRPDPVGGPPAVAAPTPAPPPVPVAPAAASLGFAFRCNDCGIVAVAAPQGHIGRWRFADLPVVDAVDREGPAWAAGLRSGDAIVAVDDIPLTTADGGRRFYTIRDGQDVSLTVRRDGLERKVRFQARTPRAFIPEIGVAPTLPEVLTRAAETTLRYTGTLGDTAIEVRGAPVTVSEDRGTGEIIIRSADLEVRLKRQQGGR